MQKERRKGGNHPSYLFLLSSLTCGLNLMVSFFLKFPDYEQIVWYKLYM